MGPKYEHFKFKIGEFVQLRQLSDASIVSRKMIVAGLFYEECPGGVQLFCLCRNIGFDSPVRYLETELEPYAKTLVEIFDEQQRADMEIRAAIRRSKFDGASDTTMS